MANSDPRRLFCVPGSGGRAPLQREPAPELTLAGRRYRLVPVQDVPLAEQGRPPVAAELLTARELQIVALVAEGRVNKQIADDLRISEWTVSTHLRRIFAKLGVDTRAAMVSRCLQLLPGGNGHPSAPH
jgi:DNA-binding CsgD family transcriptional regulator